MKFKSNEKNLPFFLIPILLGATLSGAQQSPKQNLTLQTLLENYIKIQETLASDSSEGVEKIAKIISTQSAKIHFTHLSNQAQSELKSFPARLKNTALSLAKEKEIKPMRDRFKAVSNLLVQWAKIEKLPGIQIVHCSMANASWLQKTGPTRNPYYGKAMLECGEVQE
jgi:membrane fusion protein, copper/silver efflux system